MTVVGAAVGGGERTAHVFDYYVPADIFPVTAHYVALGHIHRPQPIPGRCPIWYAGSPFALDFGETHGEHCVLVIEAEAGKPARVRRVPLTSGRALRTIRGSSLELEATKDTTSNDFLRIIVEESPVPGLAEGVREMFPHAVDVIVARPEGSKAEREAIDPGKLRDPLRQFRRYLQERDIAGEELAKLFKQLLDDEYASAQA